MQFFMLTTKMSSYFDEKAFKYTFFIEKANENTFLVEKSLKVPKSKNSPHFQNLRLKIRLV